jgi:hypothetical protein
MATQAEIDASNAAMPGQLHDYLVVEWLTAEALWQRIQDTA